MSDHWLYCELDNNSMQLTALRAAVFVPVDFNAAEPLQVAISPAGYDSRRRTLFLWEGVTNYLTEEAVNRILRMCVSARPGSTVVFTYIDQQVLDHPESFHGTNTLRVALRAAGERWTFGLDPARLSSFLAQRGLLLSEDVGASDYRRRYFGDAARRMRGYEFYRIGVAAVADPSLTSDAAEHGLAADAASPRG